MYNTIYQKKGSEMLIKKEEEVISASLILDEYLLSETDVTLYDYFLSKVSDVDEQTMIELYLSAVVLGMNADSLELTEETTIQIGKYKCISAYKNKEFQNEI